ncbi:MAG TPA: hypothetical protein VH834_00460 [Solirubrobacteraceae bacterium]|jgi:hypothetical protein
MADGPAKPIAPSAAHEWPRRRTAVVVGAVVLALLAGLLVWLLARGDGDEKNAAPSVPVGRPVALSDADLRAFARAQALPVYWAGPRANTTYELTRSAGGQIYIRYLPTGVRVGDPRPGFVTVGTYPQQNAYAALTAAGKRKGYTAVTAQSGALIVYNRRKHASVYFTFPGAAFQVEAYDPRPGQARAAVLRGGIVQLR